LGVDTLLIVDNSHTDASQDSTKRPVIKSWLQSHTHGYKVEGDKGCDLRLNPSPTE